MPLSSFAPPFFHSASTRRLLLAALLLAPAACSGGDTGKHERPAPLVAAATVADIDFVDRIEAVGTALANEQVTLAAPVTERIERLNFDDGAVVSRGQVLAVLARTQENAQYSQARATALEAEQQLARIRSLRERGFATNASLDAQVAVAGAARAQAAQANAQISDRILRAPFAGYVSLRNISAGAVVTAGTPVATISDLSRIKLDFTVPETMLAAIRTGQPIEARAAAYPDRRFRGTIATIDPVIDPATRAVTVRAILPNGDRLLKPGMLLTVTIESSPRRVAAVPELAVVGEGAQRFVFVIGPDDKVRRTQVRTGTRDGGRIEIVEGLRVGQRVVGEGVVKVSDGMKVRVEGAPSRSGPTKR